MPSQMPSSVPSHIPSHSPTTTNHYTDNVADVVPNPTVRGQISELLPLHPTATSDIPANPPRILAVNQQHQSLSNSLIWVIGGLVGIVLFGFLLVFLIWFYFVGNKPIEKEETQMRLYRETRGMRSLKRTRSNRSHRNHHETRSHKPPKIKGKKALFLRKSGNSPGSSKSSRSSQRSPDIAAYPMTAEYEAIHSPILGSEGTGSDSSEMYNDFEPIDERKFETLEELHELDEPAEDEESDDDDVGSPIRPKVRFGTISAGDSDAHSRYPTNHTIHTVNISVNGPQTPRNLRKWSKDDIEIGLTVSRFDSRFSADADSRRHQSRDSKDSKNYLFPHILPRGSDVDEMDSGNVADGVPRSSEAAMMMDKVVHSRETHLTVDSADIAAVMRSLALNGGHVKSLSNQSNATDDFISNGEMDEEEYSVDTVVRLEDEDEDVSSDGNVTIVSMDEAKRMNSAASLSPSPLIAKSV